MYKILLATDGSTFSLKTADYVSNMFHTRPDAEVTILYVDESYKQYNLTPMPDNQGREMVEHLLEQMKQKRKAVLTSTAEHLSAFGSRVNRRSADGKTSDVICDIAEKEGFNLVVIGGCGKGGEKSSVLGSVCYAVVNQCKVPVLVVR